MAQVRIFGPRISTYVRIVQIVCEEAGLTHAVVPTAAHAPENRHPFGKVPVVEVDGLEMSETAPVIRYLDNRHNAGRLQPADPVERYTMDRWMAVNDAYLFPLFERAIVMPYVMHRFAGQPLDRERIDHGLPMIARTLEFLELELARDGAWTRAGFTLADVMFYTTLLGLRSTPEGGAGIAECDRLAAWMTVCDYRPSILATRWEAEPDASQS